MNLHVHENDWPRTLEKGTIETGGEAPRASARQTLYTQQGNRVVTERQWRPTAAPPGPVCRRLLLSAAPTRTVERRCGDGAAEVEDSKIIATAPVSGLWQVDGSPRATEGSPRAVGPPRRLLHAEAFFKAREAINSNSQRHLLHSRRVYVKDRFLSALPGTKCTYSRII